MKQHLKLLLLLLLCCWLQDSSGFVSNHSFVFISGWPQSGTSLVHQILNAHEAVGSMIEMCEKILGEKRCVSFNHEGQWMLPGNMRARIMSGQVCRVDRVDGSTKAGMLSEWQRYWDSDKMHLIEKSPQSFLKLNLMRQVFNESADIKFIIILKHPVTLNVATQKTTGWRYFDQTSVNPRFPPGSEISAEQRLENAKYFLNFMTYKNNCTNEKDICALGWLHAMNELYSILESNPSLKPNVRIVRYENFLKPKLVCYSLFAFIFKDSKFPAYRMRENLNRLCSNLFNSPPATTLNPGKVIEPITDRQRRVPNPKRKSRQQRINRKLAALEESEVSANSSSRRQLRLRASDKGLQFRPELVTQRAKDRIAEFLYALSQLPSEVQDEINRLQPELEKFGYQLKYIYNSKHSAKALFNDWELLPSINE